MQRRQFINNSLITGVGISLFGNSSFFTSYALSARKPILKKGDLVGLISPGSAISTKQHQLAKMQLKSMGLTPYFGENCTAKSGYLAGTDQQRVDDLHEMYSNKKVKAIWAIRGGYGDARLLPLLDFSLIKKNKKPIIGYSDLTVLINVIYQKTGIINYHFTMPGALFTPFGDTQINNYLFDNQSVYSLDGLNTINSLSAKGRLLGGNLSVLASIVGTPNEVNLDNAILFLEDIGEKPYRIDRMMTQMKQAGLFNKVKGLIIGQFTDCDGDRVNGQETTEDLVLSFFADMNIPKITNAPIGHIESQWALPIGAEARLDLSKKRLTIDW